MDILISINPPYTEMILSGYKYFEFRKKVVKYMKGQKIYIYETKNKGGIGKVVGEATVQEVLHFSKFLFDYIPKLDIKYLEKIGCTNEKGDFTDWLYAIKIKNARRYDKPLELNDFLNTKLNKIKRPPQNMCYCYEDRWF